MEFSDVHIFLIQYKYIPIGVWSKQHGYIWGASLYCDLRPTAGSFIRDQIVLKSFYRLETSKAMLKDVTNLATDVYVCVNEKLTFCTSGQKEWKLTNQSWHLHETVQVPSVENEVHYFAQSHVRTFLNSIPIRTTTIHFFVISIHS